MSLRGSHEFGRLIEPVEAASAAVGGTRGRSGSPSRRAYTHRLPTEDGRVVLSPFLVPTMVSGPSRGGHADDAGEPGAMTHAIEL